MDILDKFKLDFKAKGEVYLKVKAIPGAPMTEVKNVMADGAIKIAVAAIPEKGKANQALIGFLAEEFGVPRGQVSIISGAGVRVKLIHVTHNT